MVVGGVDVADVVGGVVVADVMWLRVVWLELTWLMCDRGEGILLSS